MNINWNGALNKCAFFMKKYSPALLVGGGVLGGAACTVMACRATTRLPEVHAQVLHRVEQAKETEAEEAQDKQRRVLGAWMRGGMDYVRLYAPACLMGCASAVSILTGAGILHRRNMALTAAYTALNGSYLEYRGRVRERLGEEAEADIARETACGLLDARSERSGEEDQSASVCYARYFREGDTRAWEPDETYNRFFLSQRERWANDRLKADGFLFLNDVYEALGFDKTRAGQVVGWVYDPENADKYQNDNRVSFRMQDIREEDPNDPEGILTAILLDFNVDGVIMDHACGNGLKA